jgi:hypothetical protein
MPGNGVPIVAMAAQRTPGTDEETTAKSVAIVSYLTNDHRAPAMFRTADDTAAELEFGMSPDGHVNKC